MAAADHGALLIVCRGRERTGAGEAEAGGAAPPQEAQQAGRQEHQGRSFLPSFMRFLPFLPH